MHRPYTGKVKGVLITHSSDRWYVIIQAEKEASESKREARLTGPMLSLNSFTVDSDGGGVRVASVIKATPHGLIVRGTITFYPLFRF